MKYKGNPFVLKEQEPTATIDVSALLKTTAAGRNLIAYIIERQLSNVVNATYVILDKLEIQKYYREKISESYANEMNVTRGIKNLLEVNVLAESDIRGKYWINRNCLRK